MDTLLPPTIIAPVTKHPNTLVISQECKMFSASNFLIQHITKPMHTVTTSFIFFATKMIDKKKVIKLLKKAI
ncbi:hypothetical protein CDL62_10915 [Alkalitalea saponilacus]|nr:hypothetical protein CDL62_10915 [Alkalitalea saponilacus]